MAGCEGNATRSLWEFRQVWQSKAAFRDDRDDSRPSSSGTEDALDAAAQNGTEVAVCCNLFLWYPSPSHDKDQSHVHFHFFGADSKYVAATADLTRA